ncbi:hypothetical protein E6O75_ATG06305 [Venturia nashicola]|uniref:Uncharacterized protein n=1 Tax=Venturia nashicola TaxID=86259 RepID=A0A4Z1NTH8_9PEZI|nr:hypothetical protein E6O75_ATG06305 [Venturia nashicola]
MADAGAEVTVLQAASELGEIGAGIDAGAHAALAVEKELRGRETVAQKGWRKDIRKETYDRQCCRMVRGGQSRGEAVSMPTRVSKGIRTAKSGSTILLGYFLAITRDTVTRPVFSLILISSAPSPVRLICRFVRCRTQPSSFLVIAEPCGTSAASASSSVPSILAIAPAMRPLFLVPSRFALRRLPILISAIATFEGVRILRTRVALVVRAIMVGTIKTIAVAVGHCSAGFVYLEERSRFSSAEELTKGGLKVLRVDYDLGT